MNPKKTIPLLSAFRHTPWPSISLTFLVAALPPTPSLALDPVAVLQVPDAVSGYGAGFGRAVAISGDWIAVGAPDDDQFADESGAVYIFRRDGARWVFHEKLKALVLQEDRMGYSLAMDGDWLVAGAPNFPSYLGSPGGLGRAYVFRRDERGTPENIVDDRWRAVAVFNPPPSHLCCNFGLSVDIAGDVAVVGRSSGEHQIGSAYAFRWTGSEWLPDGVLMGADTEEGDSFGRSVATNGNSIIVGSPFDDDAGDHSGSAYVFHKEEGKWVQAAKLLAPDPGSPGAFGASIAVDDLILVVTPHVFRLQGMEWSYEATMSPANESEQRTFGGPAAVSEGNVLIGSPSAEGPGLVPPAGATYLFRQWTAYWQQGNKLTANPSRFLGSAVAVHGDFAVSNVFVHRICDGCGTLREFARFQLCAGATTASSDLKCDVLDFNGDGAVALPDLAAFVSILVGP